MPCSNNLSDSFLTGSHKLYGINQRYRKTGSTSVSRWIGWIFKPSTHFEHWRSNSLSKDSSNNLVLSEVWIFNNLRALNHNKVEPYSLTLSLSDLETMLTVPIGGGL
ncbi:unnamed protein product [Trichobilharzia szidati]|nr:unnamed protein product [Trichobilharzia szidati]